MTAPRILLVEDEEHIAQGLFFNLEQEGYLVTHVETGSEAMRAFDNEHFDLVVLDLMLPDSHGIDLCQRMRQTSPQLPILILTALGEEQSRVKGLQAGADDYLSKPFNLEEFLLRVSGMLKRSSWYQPDFDRDKSYRFGSNSVDLKNLQADTASGVIRLTELEGRMLETFFARAGETLTRAELPGDIVRMRPGVHGGSALDTRPRFPFRRVAQNGCSAQRFQVAYLRDPAIGRDLDRDRPASAERGRELGLVDHHDLAARGLGDDLFAQKRPPAALDHVKGRIHLVGAVKGKVELG